MCVCMYVYIYLLRTIIHTHKCLHTCPYVIWYFLCIHTYAHHIFTNFDYFHTLVKLYKILKTNQLLIEFFPYCVLFGKWKHFCFTFDKSAFV